MGYRIEFANKKYGNYVHNRKELLEKLAALKDEVISDIRKVYKNGVEDSVLEKYQKYLKENSPAPTPTKVEVQDQTT